jgi:hypothetical protein
MIEIPIEIDYNKIYEISDFRLDTFTTLQFSEDYAMITTLSFQDLGFILDVLHIEKIKDNFDLVIESVMSNQMLYYIILTKKTKGELK